MFKFFKNIFKKSNCKYKLFRINDYSFKCKEDVLNETNSIFTLYSNVSKHKLYTIKKIDNRFYFVTDDQCLINIPINKVSVTNE